MAQYTLSRSAHYNGGSRYSRTVYDVLRDGEPTGIVWSDETNGRPRYQYTSRVLTAANGEEFDLLAMQRITTINSHQKQAKLEQWLDAH